MKTFIKNQLEKHYIQGGVPSFMREKLLVDSKVTKLISEVEEAWAEAEREIKNIDYNHPLANYLADINEARIEQVLRYFANKVDIFSIGIICASKVVKNELQGLSKNDLTIGDKLRGTELPELFDYLLKCLEPVPSERVNARDFKIDWESKKITLTEYRKSPIRGGSTVLGVYPPEKMTDDMEIATESAELLKNYNPRVGRKLKHHDHR